MPRRFESQRRPERTEISDQKNEQKEMNQVTNHNAKHALLMEAGAGLCAVNAAAHVNSPCGTWSYVSFDMLRTQLVTIQGDPGSGG